MLHGQEFDLAEFSMSTYLMAIDRKLPITGVPVFPRRLFSAGLFFVRADSPLHTPADLAGQARRAPLVPDHLVAARQGRPQVRIRRAVGRHPLARERRREDRVRAEAGREHRDAAAQAPIVGALAGATARSTPSIQPHPPHSITSGEVPSAPAVRRSRRRGTALFQEIRLLPDHAHPRDPPGAGRARSVGCLGAVMAMYRRRERDLRIDITPIRTGRACLRAGAISSAERDVVGDDHLAEGVAANRNNLERFIDVFPRPGIDQRRLRRSTSCSPRRCGRREQDLR